ncbi:hypothetical protein PPYR_13049 [Photinus pyralis]|uniref:BESS domain-containing protein n=2 Tax=Photinus pyralis TaxID=7054 RepID=A0A5N4A810_PHOPY|nr:hypothetical protein PPYR_13049 [Photinus pyralis]
MGSFLHTIYTPRKTQTLEEVLTDEEDFDVASPAEDTTTTNERVNLQANTEPPVETGSTVEPEESQPPGVKKRKVVQPKIIEKSMNDAFTLLKQVANKPKAVETKDESSLFCELLILKLRALDNETRELAMHDIDNLMFSYKKSTSQPPYWSQIYQQPGSNAHSFSHSRSQTPASSHTGSVHSASSYNIPTATSMGVLTTAPPNE